MYCDEIVSVITEYLNNPKAEYAIMIDGEWGSGKTYFLTHSLMKLMQTIDNGKDKRRRYAYVSLYGSKSVDEISREIVFQCFGKKNKKKVENVDMVMETASNILTASVGAVNIDLSKLKDTLPKIDVNNWIICFDDLERCCIPINEILGYMNHLVEHNRCKVIVLANEKEIGKINLNQKLEEKYQLVLSGRKIRLNKDNSSGTDDNNSEIDIENLKKETKILFSEDILYRSIREKVIGVTIKYETCMDDAYDSIIVDYNFGGKFKDYLIDNKTKILKCFEDEECTNLRTLISVLGTIQKVFDEMTSRNYDTVSYYDRIMEEFVIYIVLFTISHRKGEDVRRFSLLTKIGYVPLGKNIFRNIKGFKFLERYCTTLSFSEQEFESVVSSLRKEYEEEESKTSKIKEAKAYSELSCWWTKEDDEVNELIVQLKEEIRQDKYLFSNYQSIIGQLLQLKHWGHNIGDMDELIATMNQNIDNADGEVDIERHSFSFEKDSELRKQYDEYVDRLKLKANSKNHLVKASEVANIMNSEKWAEDLYEYCDENFNMFLARYGFFDLLDIEILSEKLKSGTTKELRQVKDIFTRVYRASNINEFFANDTEKIKEFRGIVDKVSFSGINKPMAKNALVEYLDDIIERLEKEVNIYSI